jgi:hypothetical protein
MTHKVDKNYYLNSKDKIYYTYLKVVAFKNYASEMKSNILQLINTTPLVPNSLFHDGSDLIMGSPR